MNNINNITAPVAITFRQKLTDYNQLAKVRLTLLVVFSAVITYLTAARGTEIIWFEVWMLSLGGFLVVAASNGINQIIEKDFELVDIFYDFGKGNKEKSLFVQYLIKKK